MLDPDTFRFTCAECGTGRDTGRKCEVCSSFKLMITGKKTAKKGKKDSKKAPLTPTLKQFRAYQGAWDYFNAKLFGGTLKPCLLVFREGKRTKAGKSMGHFAPNRWTNSDGELTHEISINPDLLHLGLVETMDTLVHEMVHQWQQDHGIPPRKGYHDRQWAAKMVEVGLIPSDTGLPGGKQTGQHMSDYIGPGGPFDRAVNSMPAAIALPWTTRPEGLPGASETETDEEGEEAAAEAKKKLKVKYTCPKCGCNVWGKPGLKISCEECEESFEEI